MKMIQNKIFFFFNVELFLFAASVWYLWLSYSPIVPRLL